MISYLTNISKTKSKFEIQVNVITSLHYSCNRTISCSKMDNNIENENFRSIGDICRLTYAFMTGKFHNYCSKNDIKNLRLVCKGFDEYFRSVQIKFNTKWLDLSSETSTTKFLKSCNEIAPDYFRNIIFLDPLYPEPFKSVLQVTGMTLEKLNIDLKYKPELSLHRPSFYSTSDYFQIIHDYALILHSLTLNVDFHNMVSQEYTRVPSVRQLHLEEINKDEAIGSIDAYLGEMLQAFPNVEEFSTSHLFDGSRISKYVLGNHTRLFSKLHTFRGYICPDSLEFAEVIAKSSKLFKQIKLCFWTDEPNSSIKENVFKYWPETLKKIATNGKLEDLNIFNKVIDIGDLFPSNVLFNSIKNLHIEFSKWKPDSLYFLEQFPKLRSLRMQFLDSLFPYSRGVSSLNFEHGFKTTLTKLDLWNFQGSLSFLTKFTALKELLIKMNNDRGYRQKVQYFPITPYLWNKLIYLQLYQWNGSIKWIKNFKTLQTIKIQVANTRLLPESSIEINCGQNLKKLSLHKWNKPLDFIQSCTRLEKFSLSTKNSIKTGVPNLFQCGKTLKSLKMKKIHGIDINKLIPCCNNLERITFDACDFSNENNYMEKEVLENMFSGLTKLKTVLFCKCKCSYGQVLKGFLESKGVEVNLIGDFDGKYRSSTESAS